MCRGWPQLIDTQTHTRLFFFFPFSPDTQKNSKEKKKIGLEKHNRKRPIIRKQKEKRVEQENKNYKIYTLKKKRQKLSENY